MIGRALLVAIPLAALVVALSTDAPALQTGGGPSQAQMNEKARREYKKADVTLNRAYERLAKALEPGPRARLRAAELAWLRFRDAESEFRASEFKGATLQPAARLGYLEDLTRRRTKELVDAYKQFAGD